MLETPMNPVLLERVKMYPVRTTSREVAQATPQRLYAELKKGECGNSLTAFFLMMI